MLDGLDTAGLRRRHGRHPAGDGRRPLARLTVPARDPGSASCAPRAAARERARAAPARRSSPSSMKTTRSPTSRAKAISWVTTIIVIPSATSSRITSSTSLTSSGSSALVTSSKSIRCGSIASARAIATRCCWPPESRSGYWSSLSASPTRSSRPAALRPRLLARAAEHLFRRHRHVLHRRSVGEEVELLEDDPDPLANVVELPPCLALRRAPAPCRWSGPRGRSRPPRAARAG